MCHSIWAAFAFIFVTAGFSATTDQFVARYLPLNGSDSSNLLAVDASGNYFVVSQVTEPSGSPRIRATKVDPQGNVLASFDFGGTYGYSDTASGVAVDQHGNLIIVGSTFGLDFPLVSPIMSKVGGLGAFVVKLDSQLTTILFSTLLGPTFDPFPGSGATMGKAVTVDSAGNIYLTGSTAAIDFPITPGAFQSSPPHEGPFHQPFYAFVTEIAADGSKIVFSTYFGSSSIDCTTCMVASGITSGNAIALDASGAIIIGGATNSNQLPVTAGTLGQQCKCPVSDGSQAQSGFLAKFAPGGQKLDWATYVPLAQTGELSIASLAVDAQGNVIFGGSAPAGLTTTQGALQSSYPGASLGSVSEYQAGFIAKMDAEAGGYIFSTYFGNAVYDSPNGVVSLALDPQRNIWATGGSDPTLLPYPKPVPSLGSTYVAELSADGSSVMDAITAPAGAAGQAVVVAPNSLPASLGSAGSLLLDLPNPTESLIFLMNSAGIKASGNIAPFELISLYGAAIGPANAMSGTFVNGSLSTSLGGVQVLFNNVAAPLLYAGPNQINAIVPSAVTGQDTVDMQIVTSSGTLTGPSLTVVPSEPEVFQSSGAAIALNHDGSLNSASNPAAAGSVVTIWTTGDGLEPSFDQDGTIATTLDGPLLPVSVLNATNPAAIDSLEVQYAGNSPGMVIGAIQVNFRLPDHITLGANQITCELQVGGSVSSRFSIFVKQ